MDIQLKLALGAALFSLSACSSPADDLQAICTEVTLQSTSDSSAEERALVVAQNLESKLKTEPIRLAWQAVANAAPDQRYALMQAAASEVGVDDWQCPALQAHWSTTETAE